MRASLFSSSTRSHSWESVSRKAFTSSFSYPLKFFSKVFCRMSRGVILIQVVFQNLYSKPKSYDHRWHSTVDPCSLSTRPYSRKFHGQRDESDQLPLKVSALQHPTLLYFYPCYKLRNVYYPG